MVSVKVSGLNALEMPCGNIPKGMLQVYGAKPPDTMHVAE